MIILKIKGRLGNQLFQYSFCKELATALKDEIIIDWSLVESRHEQEGDGWCDSLKDFNTEYKNIVNGENYLSRTQKNILKITRLIERIQLQFTKITKQPYEIPDCWAKFASKYGIYYRLNGYVDFNIPCKKGIQNKYVYGYFECAKYFKDVESIIKKEITSRQLIKSNDALYRTICESESICLSVRRGDFFKGAIQDVYGVCTEEYYRKGIQYIKNIYPGATIILFSDDIEWVKENLKFDGKVYYETGNDPVWEKLRLMSACKHFVISNSTFSWWAQYLGTYSNKIVVAPSEWRRDKKKNDIYEKTWIRIDTIE